MKQEKIKTSISMDSDLYRQIKELGEKENRSFSQQLTKMAQDRLAEYKRLEKQG